MSKIGKKNITIPKDSSVTIEGSNLIFKGPKGSKNLTINDKIFSSSLKENQFQILPLDKKVDKKTSIMWGTYRSLINNAVLGVSRGHEKILELNGVGFRANLKGEILNLQIGFSHDVNFKIPKEIKITQPDGVGFSVDRNKISWEGWYVRVSLTPDEGVVLHELSLNDRPILFRAAMGLWRFPP